MSAGTFLKKIGTDIAKGALLAGEALVKAEGYGSLLNAILPAGVASTVTKVETTVGNDLSAIDDIIKQVEAVGSLSGMTGAQKLEAASGLAVNAFGDVMDVIGKSVADPDLMHKAQTEFTMAVEQLVQARVDFLNALKPTS